jgi:hypothetical protein
MQSAWSICAEVEGVGWPSASPSEITSIEFIARLPCRHRAEFVAAQAVSAALRAIPSLCEAGRQLNSQNEGMNTLRILALSLLGLSIQSTHAASAAYIRVGNSTARVEI